MSPREVSGRVFAMMIGATAFVVVLLAARAPVTYMAHGYCYRWDPWLIALHLTSDGLIMTAYLWIPLSLVTLARNVPLDAQIKTVYGWLRRPAQAPVALREVMLWSAAFVLSCGATHGMEMFVLAIPAYWVQGFVKLTCAAISVRASFLITRLAYEVWALHEGHTHDEES